MVNRDDDYSEVSSHSQLSYVMSRSRASNSRDDQQQMLPQQRHQQPFHPLPQAMQQQQQQPPQQAAQYRQLMQQPCQQQQQGRQGSSGCRGFWDDGVDESSMADDSLQQMLQQVATKASARAAEQVLQVAVRRLMQVPKSQSSQMPQQRQMAQGSPQNMLPQGPPQPQQPQQQSLQQRQFQQPPPPQQQGGWGSAMDPRWQQQQPPGIGPVLPVGFAPDHQQQQQNPQQRRTQNPQDVQQQPHQWQLQNMQPPLMQSSPGPCEQDSMQQQQQQFVKLGPCGSGNPDVALLHMVLNEIVNLLQEENQHEKNANGSNVPPAVAMRWLTLSSSALAAQSKTLALEGKCLLDHDRRADLAFSHEQTILYLFMRSPFWIPIFTMLSRRVTALLANRLSPNFLAPPTATTGTNDDETRTVKDHRSFTAPALPRFAPTVEELPKLNSTGEASGSGGGRSAVMNVQEMTPAGAQEMMRLYARSMDCLPFAAEPPGLEAA